ncbi:hypothetical protein P1N98_06335, partial [Tsukamurella tyrosinosolvens]
LHQGVAQDVREADLAAAAEQLRKQIKDTIGVSVTVDVVEPGGLERSVGKARRLIDNRPKD